MLSPLLRAHKEKLNEVSVEEIGEILGQFLRRGLTQEKDSTPMKTFIALTYFVTVHSAL